MTVGELKCLRASIIQILEKLDEISVFENKELPPMIFVRNELEAMKRLIESHLSKQI